MGLEQAIDTNAGLGGEERRPDAPVVASARPHGPVVRAGGNTVDLRFEDQSFYTGRVYVGGVVAQVIFDTRTDWTGVVLDRCDDCDAPSFYDPLASGSVVLMTDEEKKYLPEDAIQMMDQCVLKGHAYKDQICLTEPPENTTCVPN